MRYNKSFTLTTDSSISISSPLKKPFKLTAMDTIGEKNICLKWRLLSEQTLLQIVVKPYLSVYPAPDNVYKISAIGLSTKV